METILQVRGLCKYFGTTIANDHIDFDLKKGEVRGLAGENGSGKSTLLQQIAGIYIKDEGTMTLNGQPYDPKNPVDAINNKIGIVVQELGVLSNLPAGINVFAGRLKRFKKLGMINMKEVYKKANELFENYGLMKVPLNKSCSLMSIEERKMVELARALSDDPDILILDEVTQSLSQNNREMLHRLIARLKNEGKTVVVITHDLEEMIEICDSITVLRDGHLIETRSCDGLDPSEIKRLMVGREVSDEYYRTDMTANYSDEVCMHVEGVTVPGQIEDITFDVHKGEILGFCGLSDSGIHEVGKAIYGLEKEKHGKVTLPGMNAEIHRVEDSVKYGIGYVPKDRDAEALMMTDTIAANFALPSMDELQGKGVFLSPARITSLTNTGIEDYNVKCTGKNQKIGDLSGGNKQKINLGRWLIKDLNAIILDCPTRGVDVSVKAYIYHVMNEAKKKGLAMILISDELPEVIGMSDRLIIMKNGKIAGEFTRSKELDQETLIEVMV